MKAGAPTAPELIDDTAFPAAWFTVDVDPAAMRASAEAYEVVAARAASAVSQLGPLTLDDWVGAEGDLYRRTHRAYLPMVTDARPAFAGVAQAVRALAVTCEYVLRRMEVVAPAARTAWERLRQARERHRATGFADPFSLVAGRPIDTSSTDPQVRAEQRIYDQLVEEAGILHRRVAEAAAEAAGVITRLPAPPATPSASRGASPFGPTVVAREGTRYSGSGAAGWFTGGLAYEKRLEQMSDGTWKVVVLLDADAGAQAGKDLLEAGPAEGERPGHTTADTRRGHDEAARAGSEASGGPGGQVAAGAEARAQIGGRTQLEWEAPSRQAAQARLDEVERALLTAGLVGGASLAGLRPDAAYLTGRVTADASAEAGMGDTKTGAKISGTVGLTTGVRRDGSRRTSFEVSGEAVAEHPVITDKGATQQSYGGSKGFTATLDVARDGRGVLTVATRTEKAGENRYTVVERSRLLTPEQVRQFQNAPKDLAAGGLNDPRSDSRRALDLARQTLDARADSPEVRDGTVAHRETTYETDSESDPLTLGPVELERTTSTERAVGPTGG